MNIGYIRVSTKEQSVFRQEVLMQELGVQKLFIDKCSGKNKQRPQLQAMLEFAREGDTIIVSEISRFARNTKDLLELIETLTNKKIEFVSKKENIDTKTPTGRFMLTVFGAVAELQRNYILETQKIGIEEAKRLGKFQGRKSMINDIELKKLYIEWKKGQVTATRASELLGITRQTWYRKVKELEEIQKNNLKIDND